MNLRAMVTNPKNLLLILGGATGLFLVIIVVVIIGGIGVGGGGPSVTLQFWGPFDDGGVYQTAIREFNRLNKRISIEYTRLSTDDYEGRLIDALASGKAPDIVMIHNTWINKHGEKFRAMPDKAPDQDVPLMTVKQYKEQFVDVAYDDFVRQGKIYAMPLYVDTLALYYNKDLLNTAGISRPPTTWEEFNRDVELLTKIDDRGNFSQMGAAIGATHNINRATDILMDLMLQSGAQMTDKEQTRATFISLVNDEPVGERALQYYTDFTNPTKRVYTWNENQHYSIDAFAEGIVAMMFNYSYQLDFLRMKNARLNFTVAPMPQASLDDIRNFANYWAPAVSAASKNPNEAWEFINYLASAQGVRSYLTATKRPSARRDVIELQRNDPELGVFAVQSLTAKSWVQVDNIAIEKIFSEMIDDVNLGRLSALNALKKAATNVDVLFQKKRGTQ